MNQGLLSGMRSKRPREIYYPNDDKVLWTPLPDTVGATSPIGAGFSYTGTNAGIIQLGKRFVAGFNGRVLFKWQNVFTGGNPNITFGIYKNGLPFNESPLVTYNWSGNNIVQQELPVRSGDIIQAVFNDNFNTIVAGFNYIYLAAAAN